MAKRLRAYRPVKKKQINPVAGWYGNNRNTQFWDNQSHVDPRWMDLSGLTGSRVSETAEAKKLKEDCFLKKARRQQRNRVRTYERGVATGGYRLGLSIFFQQREERQLGGLQRRNNSAPNDDDSDARDISPGKRRSADLSATHNGPTTAGDAREARVVGS
uniref:Uncharacterized protein n=1 Tax=Panagrellus redivivus TaxID=6233 RepID=A0A7E4VS83_PANRE